MKVICKNANYIMNLTEGKEYECLTVYEEWEKLLGINLVSVINDIGEEMDAGKWRFELAPKSAEAIQIEEKIIKKLSEPDPVNHPSHYTQGKYEVIDVIEDWDLGFNLGNAVKYIGRAGHKDDIVQDLEKAKWYIEREIQRLKKNQWTDDDCIF